MPPGRRCAALHPELVHSVDGLLRVGFFLRQMVDLTQWEVVFDVLAEPEVVGGLCVRSLKFSPNIFS
jgi:hypothetical protein